MINILLALRLIYPSTLKLKQLQMSKNSELASVLIKFEERVKQRDKRLEEAAAADAALRRELEQREIVSVT